MRGAGNGSAAAMQDAMKNPQNYTKSQPNGASKAAFVVGSNVGAGRDGMKKGPDTAYYKIERAPAHAPAAAAPAPAPAPPPSKPQPKPPEPIKYSPEIQQAKERVNKYQSDVMSGKVSEEIYGKDTYISESTLNKNQSYNFSQNAFGNDRKKKA